MQKSIIKQNLSSLKLSVSKLFSPKPLNLTIAFLFCFVSLLYSQNDTITAHQLNSYVKADSSDSKISFSYGNKGWEMGYHKKFLMQVQWRFQFRGELNSKIPDFYIGEEDNLNSSFNIQRARLKVGGYAYSPFLNYYLEYDFPSTTLLNWEFTLSKNRAFQLKLGQWKIKYNTERFISSGKQQFVERSISNRYFTLDRQMGVLIKGDLFNGKLGSSSYNIGIFNGNGIMAQNNNGKYLLFARYQWNFSRKIMKMSYSDLSKAQKPEGFIAFAYAINQSAFTSFSSDGGGSLPGYQIGEKQQYLINQYNIEVMLKYRGFSFSNENHLKTIDDKALSKKSQIYGGYAMAGYFFNEIIKFIPKPLEITVRYAIVNNNTYFNNNINEYSFGLNWFFANHLNKLTADFSYIKNQDFIDENDNYRFRLQWDISF